MDVKRAFASNKRCLHFRMSLVSTSRHRQLRRWLSGFVFLIVVCFGDEHDHLYKEKEEVVLWMNTIGPYSNRQETYSYFSLPLWSVKRLNLFSYLSFLAEARKKKSDMRMKLLPRICLA